MDYYIGLCPAPCLLESSKILAHNENLAQARRFLQGEAEDIYAELAAEMQKKAHNLEFEDAQKIKETLEALK